MCAKEFLTQPRLVLGSTFVKSTLVLHNEGAAGVLIGLLEHEGEDFASVDALLGMVPPLESALQSYRDRAAAANRTPADVVMLEAAVQGW